MLQEYRELPLVQSVKALPIPVSILLFFFFTYTILTFLYETAAGSPEHFGTKKERTGIPQVSFNKECAKLKMKILSYMVRCMLVSLSSLNDN